MYKYHQITLLLIAKQPELIPCRLGVVSVFTPLRNSKIYSQRSIHFKACLKYSYSAHFLRQLLLFV